MTRNYFLLASLMFLCWGARGQTASPPSPPDQVLLKDYRPQSIFKIPQTSIKQAKYPAIDIHTHHYGTAHLAERVKTMDEAGIEKQIVLLDNAGPNFDKAYAAYSKFPGRFEVWCNLDFTDYKKPEFTASAVKELERCARLGAKGLGELADKGKGFYAPRLGEIGIHPDDPRMDAVWEKCADLKLPVNLHMADPKWMYEPIDKNNDGMMLAYKWRRDKKPGVDHDGLMEILERVVARHPRTIFIACHFANLEYDLNRLGAMLDKYPNLYTDSAARHQYLGTIPRFTAAFMEKYQDRILFGTDGADTAVYRETFRVWETLDEHFYWSSKQPMVIHWPLYGVGLPDGVLKKFYRDNALKILKP